MKKNKENKKIQIARLKEDLTKTIDNVERAIILGKIEKLEAEIKAEQAKKVKEKTKLNSVTEVPVVMDRKAKMAETFNGHSINKTVNGVYQNESTIISW